MRATMMDEAVVLVTESLVDDAVRRWAQLVGDAADMRPVSLVVDLRGAECIDEDAVVMLLQAHRRMTIEGGQLLLRGPNVQVREMLGHGRVDRVLDIEQPLSDG